MKWNLFVALVILNLFGLPARAEGSLSLDQFLGRVRESNDTYKAAMETQGAARLYQNESRLILSPSLFSTVQFGDDAKPSFLPAFNYEKILTENYMLGVSQQTTIGLRGQFYYQLGQTEYKGVAPVYMEGRPTLELTQSLWRNDFGREIRASITAATQGAKAKEFEAGYSRQVLLIGAETAYWRLALARENRDLAEENLKRTQAIIGWSGRRVKFALADKSELYQAQARLEERRLALQNAQSELRSASLEFNSVRGVAGDQVPEVLEPLSGEVIAGLKIPEKVTDRLDVLAAQAKTEALRAEATLGRERNQPTLELFGTYAFNSREDSKGEAFSESWNDDRSTTVVGVRFSTPLALGAVGDVQDGYAKLAKAAELQAQRTRFQQDQDWRDLVFSFNEAKARLAAVESVEKAQREKFDYERRQQGRGKTTLFQVLSFETEFLGAQGQRLQTLAHLLQIAAKLKLYGVNYESR